MSEKKIASHLSSCPSPQTIRCPAHSSWAYLRAARFTNRPGHADQLHLDLWWQGVNIAMDAGTFSYNDPVPWDNALSSTRVHNTITINGLDQMERAGRFLWLDWAQADVTYQEHNPPASFERIIARHDGYQRIGVTHQRTVTAVNGGRWIINDALQPFLSNSTHSNQDGHFLARIHWLIPAWSWKLLSEQQNTRVSIFLESPHGTVQLRMKINPGDSLSQPEIMLIRAGDILYGSGADETIYGWISPTYQSKFPALSISYQALVQLPAEFITEWDLPGS